MAAFCGQAVASGYALREQSASALGNGFAGATAAAEDLSYMYFNPAALTRQSGHQILGIGNLIMPQLKVRDTGASTETGVPITGNEGGRDAGEDAFVPTFYGMLDLQRLLDLEENVKFGVGVNVPFGVETDYRDGWIGRYHALHSKVLAINVNPALAWEVVDGVSVAAGLQVQYIRARLTNAVDFGSISGAAPGQLDGRAKVEGDDIGYGYNFGVLFEPWQGTRFGASYRSSIQHTLSGDANFTLPGGAVGAALATTFRDAGARTNVTTPDTVAFGAYHELSPDWAIMGEAQWTRWSHFRDLTIKFDSGLANSVTDQDWSDTWFFALGAIWKADEAWTIRGGAAWDQDPTRDRRRTPRIPTDDRYWLSLGAGFKPIENLSIDFGYTHVFFEDASINLTSGQTGNRFRGNLSGNAEGSADIFALQARWVF